MMLKAFAALAAVAVICSLMAGCGGKSATTTLPEASEPPSIVSFTVDPSIISGWTKITIEFQIAFDCEKDELYLIFKADDDMIVCHDLTNDHGEYYNLNWYASGGQNYVSYSSSRYISAQSVFTLYVKSFGDGSSFGEDSASRTVTLQ